MLYGPGGRNGRTYVPSALLTVLNLAPVSRSVALTLAPGITAGWGSVMRPLTLPRNCCERSGRVANRNAATPCAMRRCMRELLKLCEMVRDNFRDSISVSLPEN